MLSRSQAPGNLTAKHKMFTTKAVVFSLALLLMHIFTAPHGMATPLEKSEKKIIPPPCPLTSSGLYPTWCDPCYPIYRKVNKGSSASRSLLPCKIGLPECSPCSSPFQCKQGKCWGSKCTDGSDESLKRCFLPECAPCKSLLECSTKKCWGNKCVYDTPESMKKCFPVTIQPTVTIYTPPTLVTKTFIPTKTIRPPCPDGGYKYPCEITER